MKRDMEIDLNSPSVLTIWVYQAPFYSSGFINDLMFTNDDARQRAVKELETNPNA